MPLKMPLSSSLETVSVLSLHGKEESRVQMELMLTINWLYNRETSLDYPGGTSVITRVLKNGGMSEGQKTSCL